GQTGERLFHLARGEDPRRVSPNAAVKSISKETTFNEDTSDPDLLDGHMWRLAEQVSDRAKAKGHAGRGITLKLKRGDHRILTRRHSLAEPTQIADTIYRIARQMFDDLADRGPFRLIGVGVSDLSAATGVDPRGDLLDPDAGRRAAAERATDSIRARFGAEAIVKGRAWR
ncbi:MAG: DNA polymerase IV, partial [Gemmobacter sp.]|nr:DNA polymerase IV [Gemmobacter sp.]